MHRDSLKTRKIMSNKYVSWRRVSTFKQNRTGLGLEAQKEIIKYFVSREGGELIADYEECYTGKDLNGCKELQKAIAHAKSSDAALVIAKTDRFRNTIEALQVYEEMGDGNIMFCDLPHTDKFTLTLFFALAEREALIVGIRTKQALAVKKAQGCKLGASNEKYIANQAKKSASEIKEVQLKRGAARTKNFLETPDSQAFLKVIKNVFPDHCVEEDPKNWEWIGIRFRLRYKAPMIKYMKDFADVSGGQLFGRWDFSSPLLEKRLRSYLHHFKKAIQKDV